MVSWMPSCTVKSLAKSWLRAGRMLAVWPGSPYSTQRPGINMNPSFCDSCPIKRKSPKCKRSYGRAPIETLLGHMPSEGRDSVCFRDNIRSGRYFSKVYNGISLWERKYIISPTFIDRCIAISHTAAGVRFPIVVILPSFPGSCFAAELVHHQVHRLFQSLCNLVSFRSKSQAEQATKLTCRQKGYLRATSSKETRSMKLSVDCF
ncbi:hypothetical protein V1523DRAFT_114844 [Lipomyces doorenjongii]